MAYSAQRLLRENPAVQTILIQPHQDDVAEIEAGLLALIGGEKAVHRGMYSATRKAE